jgi:hypothetical protein
VGIYTPRILLFLDKGMNRKFFAFDDINKRQISLTYINETVSMINLLRYLIYTYEYKKIIISIRMIILDEET